jgi:hypothetical protein
MRATIGSSASALGAYDTPDSLESCCTLLLSFQLICPICIDENAPAPVVAAVETKPNSTTAHSPALSAAKAETQKEKTMDTKSTSPSILPTSPRPETIRDTPTESSSTPPPAISSPHSQTSPGQFEPQSSSAPISTASTPTSDAPPSNNEKPVQLNKGRCFSCRVKVTFDFIFILSFIQNEHHGRSLCLTQPL